MDDATVAVEVAACEALVQWPYLSDLSLIWALASIFLLPPPISARCALRTCSHRSQPSIYISCSSCPSSSSVTEQPWRRHVLRRPPANK